MLNPEDIVGLKKFYNVNTDVELFTAMDAHIKNLQNKPAVVETVPKPAVRHVRKA